MFNHLFNEKYIFKLTKRLITILVLIGATLKLKKIPFMILNTRFLKVIMYDTI